MAAAALPTNYMPILANESFCLPTADTQKHWETIFKSITNNPKALIDIIQEVFKAIMTVYQPQEYASTEAILEAKAKEVADRLMMLNKLKTFKCSYRSMTFEDKGQEDTV